MNTTGTFEEIAESLRQHLLRLGVEVSEQESEMLYSAMGDRSEIRKLPQELVERVQKAEAKFQTMEDWMLRWLWMEPDPRDIPTRLQKLLDSLPEEERKAALGLT